MASSRTSPSRAIVKPIFFIGMPRSGTTLIFASFASHPDVGWFSQYLSRVPRFPAVTVFSRLIDVSWGTRKTVARHGEKRSLIERSRIAPTEAYEVWGRCSGTKLRDQYLLGAKASEEESRRTKKMIGKVLRYQGKPRFTAKFTGPGRIGYLSSIFDDARFVHVVRDGRAVVDSLMRVPFWKDTHRLREPAWSGGVSEDQLARWRDQGGLPVQLAAIQWRTVLETTREEALEFAADRYAEVRYEDFVRNPHGLIDQILEFSDLKPDQRPHAFVEDPRLQLRNFNDGWRKRLSSDEQEVLQAEIAGTLREFGYTDDPDSEAEERGLFRPLART